MDVDYIYPYQPTVIFSYIHPFSKHLLPQLDSSHTFHSERLLERKYPRDKLWLLFTRDFAGLGWDKSNASEALASETNLRVAKRKLQ